MQGCALQRSIYEAQGATEELLDGLSVVRQRPQEGGGGPLCDFAAAEARLHEAGATAGREHLFARALDDVEERGARTEKRKLSAL